MYKYKLLYSVSKSLICQIKNVLYLLHHILYQFHFQSPVQYFVSLSTTV